MKSVCRNMSISSGALVMATMRTGSLPVLMCRCQAFRGEGNTAPFSHSTVIMSLGSRCQTWVRPFPERTRICSAKMWRSAVVWPPGGISHTHADSLAERVGFEPTIRLRVFRFSRPARSTAPSPLRLGGFYQRGESTHRFDGLESAHIRLQRHRDVYAAIGALIIFHDRNQSAAHGKPGTVQGVHQLGLALLVAKARLHAP